MQFQVQFQIVPRRMLAPTQRDGESLTVLPDAVERYHTADNSMCGAVGQRTTAKTCVIDQYVMPLATILYHLAAHDTQSIRELPVQEILAPYNTNFKAEARAEVEAECPNANSIIWANTASEESLHNILMKEYLPAESLRVSWAANKLLPSLFGLNFDLNGNMIDPAVQVDWDEDKYLQHVHCATWVFNMLHALQDALPPAYGRDPRLQQIEPGTSLYIFHSRAHIPFPFHWFWQCVLLNDPLYIHKNWLTHMSGLKASGYVSEVSDVFPLPGKQVQHCAIPRAGVQSGEQVSVRERLRASPFYFDRTEPIATHEALQLALDVDKVLKAGLDELGLPEFADLLYLKKKCNTHVDFFPSAEMLSSSLNLCFTKYGTDQTTTLIEDDEVTDERKLEELSSTGLRAKVRQFLFGQLTHERLMGSTVSSLTNYLQVLTNIDTTMVDKDQNFIPRIKFLKQLRHYSIEDYKNIKLEFKTFYCLVVSNDIRNVDVTSKCLHILNCYTITIAFLKPCLTLPIAVCWHFYFCACVIIPDHA